MRIIFFFSLLFAFFTAHAQPAEGYRQAAGGIQYKIVSDGSGALIQKGEYAEILFSSVLERPEGDTLLTDKSHAQTRAIVRIDSTEMPPSYLEIFSALRNGDSVASRTLADSIFHGNLQQMPSFIKPGEYLANNFRITRVFKTTEEAGRAKRENNLLAEAEDKKMAVLQRAQDDSLLRAYLAANNIHALRDPSGVYIEIKAPGAGIKTDSTKFASINYTGRLLNGTVFDSNTDPGKGHVSPLKINLTNNPQLGSSVIPGMTYGLRGYGKAAKINLYIPSGLAYGSRGAGGDIPPNAILIFETEILSVLPAPAPDAPAKSPTPKLPLKGSSPKPVVKAMKKPKPKL